MRFNNIKTEYNGVLYDSRGEARLAEALDRLKEYGYIKDWEPHVRFTLYDEEGKKLCEHFPDFVVTNNDGSQEIREFKGKEEQKWLDKLWLFVQNYPHLPYYVVKEKKPYKFQLIHSSEILVRERMQPQSKEILQATGQHTAFEYYCSMALHHILKFVLK